LVSYMLYSQTSCWFILVLIEKKGEEHRNKNFSPTRRKYRFTSCCK
jgi:hypothetical protein